MKIMTSVRIMFLMSVFSFLGYAADSENPKSKVKESLGRVFYWQIADELNLKPDVEKKLIQILESAQEKRQKWLTVRDDLFKDYHRQFNSLPAEKFVKTYQEFTSAMQTIDNEEYAHLKKLLNTTQLAQFLLVRDVFSKRVKEALKRVETRKMGP